MQPIVYKKQPLVGRMQPDYIIQLRQGVRKVNFCDKLQKIRKENNITQEGLADKLNVSRQAVSKWESGGAYPDTDKLIQISKIFNVSLDELINDKEIKKENKKITFMEIVNKVIEFISKSISMFFAMKFGEKLKCIFEMAILILAMVLVTWMCNSIIIEIIRKIFVFLPGNVISVICNIAGALLHIVWTILIVMVFVKIFKTRYLDYYVVITDDSVDKPIIEEPIKELKDKKDYKVVIRDPKDSSLSIFNKIGKFIVFCLKCLCIIVAIPIVFSFISLVIALIFTLSYLFDGLFFNGITLAIVGALMFLYILLEFIYNLIFNRTHAYKRIFVMFIISLFLVGSGLGLSFISFSDFEIDEDIDKEPKTYEIKMSDDLIIEDFDEIDDNKIVIDNNMKDIKLDVTTYGEMETRLYDHKTVLCDDVDEFIDNEKDVCQEYRYVTIGYNTNGFEIYKKVLKDIKHKKIHKYYDDYEIDKITLSQTNLTKLKENNKKYFDEG